MKQDLSMTHGSAGAPARPTVALALGGGGARGLAHIHVIEALDELGIRPVAIAGSSIGAIMGAGMAAGLRGEEIRAHTLSTVGHRREVVNRLWQLRPSSLSEAMASGFRFGQFNVERVLKAFLPEAIPQKFSDLEIPLKVVATDYYGQTEKICEKGDLRKALAASAALPAIFTPVRIDGRVMIDGGIYNPIPFDHLRGLADIVIAVDVVGGPDGDGKAIPSRIDSLFGASQLMMQSIIAMKLKEGAPDILLRPDVGRYRVMDFLRAQDVLNATAAIKDELKRALEERMTAPRLT
ncbi:patatin-like phospholipase family protein [Ensifer sp. ENS07]|uniref:patatin-like phospholipase family protein n=1 Tax=Ensifer TaxID=106591 RepID=UPI000715FAE6|nr:MULTISPECIES: patatin-like phospholipase family protein [Ensifer]KQX04382.1 Patatin [Ensifer sp. Root423]KQZ45943.1 Patatin [Ensifer sp. Root558]MBD9521203.1 patatin-like phospholipase family protein [Ensifer sp. ENS02]MBD9538424.1 patatin-like phospholipase family protein [Ensifer sp. ENS04]MBD9634931.1 patatin-like phospholipase family protein [Ensifer sp. ENS07]